MSSGANSVRGIDLVSPSRGDLPRSRPWIFITWYPYCRRSDAIAEQLGARSHLVHSLRFKVPALAPAKYLLQGLRTTWILLRDRPSGVLVAAPPVVAPLATWLGSLVLRYRFVIDAHSGVFHDARWTWALPLQRFLARRALATVVTNERMAETVRSWGARAVMVQDIALPLRPDGEAFRCPGTHLVYVCTYSADEPVDAVVEAARRLPEVTFSFTGDPAYAPKGFRERLPANVRLTGFIPDAEYLSLLRGADLIVVLTRQDDTMQRGAYEAMALEKPLITSGWRLLREVFAKGTIHVDNSSAAIVQAVERIRQDPQRYSREMAELKHQRSLVAAAQIEMLRSLCRTNAAGVQP